MSRRNPDVSEEPVIPTPEQILEDVLNSPDTDVIFHVNDSNADSADERVLSNEANVTFEKVREYVKLREDLKNCLEQLKDRSESLKISDCELKAMADDIRKQSIEALQ